MVTDSLRNLLNEKGFKNMGVNVQNIYLYSAMSENRAYVVILFDCPTGSEFTEGQYRNIQRQVNENFVNKNFETVQILNIIITEHLEIVKTLVMNDNVWFINTNSYKLVIYENIISDFLGLRRNLEFLLENEALKDPKFSSEFQSTNSSESNQYNSYNSESSYNDNSRYDSNTRYNGDSGYDKEFGYDRNPSYNRQENYSPKYPNTNFLGRYFSKWNTVLIILNVIIFFIVDSWERVNNSNLLVEAGALYWPAVHYFHQYYRIITYMFLHGGIEHLANNMLVLFVIGDNLERAAGKWKYLIIYFASGIIAGISSMSYNIVIQSNAISIGASGAIFGVVGAMIYIVAVNKGRLENISTRQMVVFVIFSLYGGFTSQGVDNAAHVGGLIGGFLIAAILYRRPKKKLV